jgi:very-short-patch-repair endonuclease
MNNKKQREYRSKFDWQKIQKFYDNGKTWRETREKFNVSCTSINKAAKRGDFITRNRSEAGKLHIKTHGARKHTEETKKKISKIRIEYLKYHPDKVPYLLNHYSKGTSYPEKYFIKLFKNEGINLKHHHRISLYELDFCDIEKKIDIEIDGEQHYLDQRIAKSDKRRTEYLESKGWKVFRIRWSDYQKMNRENKENYIQNFLSMIRE